MDTKRWIQSAPFDETWLFLYWITEGKTLAADLSLVPELISALMLLQEKAFEIDGMGTVIDEDLFEDVMRLLDEMHVQYREEGE